MSGGERAEPGDEDCPPPPEFAGALAREMRIVNRKGLHARATAKFVQCVDRFEAEVKVTRCGETVGGDSIMGILTLGAAMGSTITVSASGAEAKAALDAIEALVANRFGEDE
jgi:phosphocarrier protein